jgi:hypothetical protein
MVLSSKKFYVSMKLVILSAIIAIFAAALLVIVAQAQSDDACSQEYVWREAFPGDHVCVTIKARRQAANDNSNAVARREPGGYNCLPGYVWREASPSDLVCVTPYIRALTASENRQAENQRAGGVYERLRDEHPYKEPRWFGYRLDWCRDLGANCGKAAADNFCKRNIYTGARDFEQDPNIGASQPTMVSGTNQVCNQDYCNGFKYIICYGPIPSDRVFANPTISGKTDGVLHEYRLDECYNWDTGCGKRAADAYCYEETAYTNAFYWALDAEPSDAETLTIGTYEVCDPTSGWKCYGFQMIVCK